ncbi:uncharacterized protein LOC117783521 [Drosophila innubila]|uniref:uncharacterized protein LOC117783521 n=1 Tax=Drosophila innubila TaxID=198719 RepID=UPI00148BEE9F|nr:uncharacterized protein LOC117783521 [Drosophila innubila]
MKYAVIALALFVVVHAASEAGQYVPGATFTLDSEGHQSEVHPVSARLLRRLRRQSSFSLSSSSSSSSSDNGVVHQQSTVSKVNEDGSKVVQATIAHYEPTVVLAQRFGEDSPTSGFSNTAGSGSRPQAHITHISQTTDAKGHTNQKVNQHYLHQDGQWHHRETTN